MKPIVLRAQSGRVIGLKASWTRRLYRPAQLAKTLRLRARWRYP
jgi:hypothetical protein